ncbi:hypothetical protein [Streptomyces sp. MUM 16J]|uniref:hypothetical protein n=1 Tax=Streptomyces sp. MUM 16J TaxID=2791988 RepID=UPI001F04C1B7|nr:hypothetical protein [Streptomyces sp. MUM 16J]MCH0560624.1 hypothetical protein [Streptomyces sp. MUM 16J]
MTCWRQLAGAEQPASGVPARGRGVTRLGHAARGGWRTGTAVAYSTFVLAAAATAGSLALVHRVPREP